MHCHDHNQSVIAIVSINIFFRLRIFSLTRQLGTQSIDMPSSRELFVLQFSLISFWIYICFFFSNWIELFILTDDDLDTLWLPITVRMQEFTSNIGSLQWFYSVGCSPMECSCQRSSKFGVSLYDNDGDGDVKQRFNASRSHTCDDVNLYKHIFFLSSSLFPFRMQERLATIKIWALVPYWKIRMDAAVKRHYLLLPLWYHAW